MIRRACIQIASAIAVFAVAGVSGQPVQAPQINTPQFDSRPLVPIFDQARTAQNQSGWEMTVGNGIGMIRAAWEAQVQAQIDQELQLVSTSDAVNQNADYVNYVKAALVSQAQHAEAAWEAAAEAEINPQRQTFIAFLSQKEQEAAQQQQKAFTDAAIANINDPNQTTSSLYQTAAQTLAQQKAAYEQNYSKQVNNGLYQFNIAQGSLDNSYQSFLASLNQTDQQFQQNLQSISASEQNVRNAINGQMGQMQTYLQQSQQFYDTTCDAQNNCTSNMNQAGTDLLAVLTTMQTALGNNAPLSQVTQTMVDYLSAQKANAYTTQQTWQNQIDTPVTGFTNQAFDTWADYINAPGGILADMQRWIDGNHADLEADFAPNAGQTLQVTSLTMQGTGPKILPLWAWGTVAMASMDRFYTPGDPHPFAFEWNAACWFYVCRAGWAPESAIVVNFQATVHDSNAQSNATVWGGYTSDLTSAQNTWSGLLNSVNNWETQVAQYKAQYQTWQTAAQAEAQSETLNYQNASAQLSQTRNQWLSEMDAAHRQGETQWQTAALDLQIARSQTKAADAKTQQAAFTSVLQGLPKFVSHSGPGADTLNSLVSNSGLSDFANNADADTDTGLPDQRLLSGFTENFGSTLNGLQNFAFASKLNSDANSIRDQIIESEISTAKSQDGTAAYQAAFTEQYGKVEESLGGALVRYLGETKEAFVERQKAFDDQITAKVKQILGDPSNYHDNLEVTRQANGSLIITRTSANGHAILNQGADATDSNNYHVGTGKQTIFLAAPETMKLAATGSLFGGWDQGKFLSDTEDEYQKRAFDSANETMKAAFAKANNALSKNLEAYGKDASNQANIASEVKGLVMALLPGGGGLSAWIKQKTNSIIGNAFEQVTGLPGGILTNFMGGMPLTKAVTQGFTDRAKSMFIQSIDRQLGLGGAGALLLERFDQAAANKRGHEAMRGVGALNPSNIQYTTLGKTVLNANNPALGFAMAGMTGNPAFAAQGVMGIMPKGVRSGIAKGMDRLADTIDRNASGFQDGFKAMAALNLLGANPNGQMGVGFLAASTVAKKGAHGIADVVRGESRVVAQGGGSINQMTEAYHEGVRKEITVDGALERGEAQVEQNTRHFQKLNLGGAIQDLFSPITTVIPVLSKPHPQKSPAQIEFETSLSDKWSEISGWPQQFTRSYFVDRAKLGDAVTAQVYANMNAQFPGSGDMMQKRLARMAQVSARHRAARVHTEDYLPTGALTYAWRNAEVNKDGQIALQVAEIGGVVAANLVPGAGQAASYAIIAYMTAKQAYLGSLHGGTIGAVAGAASGAAKLLTGSGPVSVGVSYTFDQGWGANIGFNGQMGGGFSAGGSINIAEGQGVTGFSGNLGYGHEDGGGDFSPSFGYGGNLGFNFNAAGQFTGARIGGRFSTDAMGMQGGTGTVDGGIRLDPQGHFAGVDLNYSNQIVHQIPVGAENSPFAMFGRPFDPGQTSYVYGAGLSFNSDHTFSVNSKVGAGVTDYAKTGFNSVLATENNQILFDQHGAYVGNTSQIELEMQKQTDDQKKFARVQMQQLLDYGMLQPEDAGKVQASLNFMDPMQAKQQYLWDHPDQFVDAYNTNLPDGATPLDKNDPDAVQAAMDAVVDGYDANGRTLASVMHTTGLFVNAGNLNDNSRGFFASAIGAITDPVKNFLFGGYSDDSGYIDPANGEWVANNCFVAGTLVKTANGLVPIERIRAGDTVLAWNEKTGELTYSRVQQTFIRTTPEIYRVTYADGTVIETTWSHPFYIAGTGWVQGKDLHTGMKSPTITAIAKHNERVAMSGGYKLPVDTVSYINADGKREVALKLGGDLPGTVRISSVKVLRQRKTVYNFEVEDAHDYFVTQEGILVHNQNVNYFDPETYKQTIYELHRIAEQHAIDSYKQGKRWRDGEFGITGQLLASIPYAEGFLSDLIGAGIPANEADLFVAMLTVDSSGGIAMLDKAGQRLIIERLENAGVKVTPEMAGNLEKVALQMHHYATDKNKVFTPQLARIADQYALPLDAAWNKELLPHLGRHPNEYHEFVLQGMQRASREAGADTQEFLRLYETYVKAPIRKNPELLTKDGWKH